MAKVVDGDVKELFTRNRDGKYPWDEWLDGQVRELERGENGDFDCTPDSFRNTFYTAANERGLKAKTKELPNGNVRVVALKPDDAPVSKKAAAKKATTTTSKDA